MSRPRVPPRADPRPSQRRTTEMAHVDPRRRLALAALAAGALVAACPALPLYARVDFVRAQAGGYRLMELELVEPSLFLQQDRTALKRLVRGIAERL